MLVEFLDNSKSIGPIRRADPVVAENSDIDTGFILFLEQAVQIENRPRRLRMVPTLGHKVSVTIDDHSNFLPNQTLGVGGLNVKFPICHPNQADRRVTELTHLPSRIQGDLT